jgi:hypothetical protein
VYCKNRSPHASLYWKTPFQLRNDGKIPDLSHLRVFGTICYAHIPKKLTRKLDEKAVKCVMIGYSTKHNAYLLLDLKTHTEFVSASVNFGDEDFEPAEERERSMPEIYSPNYFRRQLQLPIDDIEYVSTMTEIRINDEEASSADLLPVAPASAEANISSNANNEQHSDEQSIDSYGSDRDYVPSELSSTSDLSLLTAPARQLTAMITNFVRSTSVIKEDVSLHQDWCYSILTETNSNDLIERKEWYSAYISQNININPKFKEAIDGPFKEDFLKAIKREYNSLKQNGVFSKPIKLPDGKRTLDTKMVLKIKESESINDPPVF